MSQAFLQIKPFQRPHFTVVFIATCLLLTCGVLVHVATSNKNDGNQAQTVDAQTPSPIMQSGRPPRLTLDPAKPGHRY